VTRSHLPSPHAAALGSGAGFLLLWRLIVFSIPPQECPHRREEHINKLDRANQLTEFWSEGRGVRRNTENWWADPGLVSTTREEMANVDLTCGLANLGTQMKGSAGGVNHRIDEGPIWGASRRRGRGFTNGILTTIFNLRTSRIRSSRAIATAFNDPLSPTRSMATVNAAKCGVRAWEKRVRLPWVGRIAESQMPWPSLARGSLEISSNWTDVKGELSAEKLMGAVGHAHLIHPVWKSKPDIRLLEGESFECRVGDVVLAACRRSWNSLKE
jgi:hypothetical protein